MHAAYMQAAFTIVMQAAYRRSTDFCSLHTVVCRLQTTVCSLHYGRKCSLYAAYIRMQHAYDMHTTVLSMHTVECRSFAVCIFDSQVVRMLWFMNIDNNIMNCQLQTGIA